MSKGKRVKGKKPLFKKWWFWLIIVFIIFIIIGASGESEDDIASDTVAVEESSAPKNKETKTTEPTVEAKPTAEPTVEAKPTTEPTTEEKTSSDATNSTEKEQIEKILRDRISEEYRSTDIERITINDDLGTDADGDYIALVYLTWNVKNSGKMSKEMLQLYSSDLAATLADQNETVNSIGIFWTVPYLNDNAKCSYERVSNGFVEYDMMWGKAFG